MLKTASSLPTITRIPVPQPFRSEPYPFPFRNPSPFISHMFFFSFFFFFLFLFVSFSILQSPYFYGEKRMKWKKKVKFYIIYQETNNSSVYNFFFCKYVFFFRLQMLIAQFKNFCLSFRGALITVFFFFKNIVLIIKWYTFWISKREDSYK